MNILNDIIQPTLVYEVSLTIEQKIFFENKKWLIDHFHDMVTQNDFVKLNLFFVKNTNPIDDDHLRYQKIVAQYYISDNNILQKYFEKQAKKMRSQVIDKLGNSYSVSRRVLEFAEVFNNENYRSC